MAWIYFQESADSVSRSNLGSEPSHIASQTDTRKLFLCPECDMLSLSTPQSGMTCEHFEANSYWPEWRSSWAVSHARTLALQDMEQAWRESEAVCFSKSSDWSMNYDRASCSWKMSRQSEHADSQPSSVNLPASGMTVAGRLFQPQNLEPRTLGKDGSCSLPTPSATSAGTNQGGGAGRKGKVRPSLETMARQNLWPTPKASDGAKGGPNQRGSKGDLTLPSAVHQWRTPNASDWKNRMEPKLGQQIHLQTQVGGQLNPTWVEWLMGFQTEWTVLDASVMQWYRFKRAKRSKSSQVLNEPKL